MKPRMKLIGCLATASLLAAAAFTAETTLHLKLEHSEDLISWQALPVTPEMLGEDGSLQWKSDAGSGFFRLSIETDAGTAPSDLILVDDGTLAMSMGTRTVETFHIARHEVTWREWKVVREWALENGYDLEGVGQGCEEDHPVHTVNWHDVLKWSNAKSENTGPLPQALVSCSLFLKISKTFSIRQRSRYSSAIKPGSRSLSVVRNRYTRPVSGFRYTTRCMAALWKAANPAASYEITPVLTGSSRSNSRSS